MKIDDALSMLAMIEGAEERSLENPAIPINAYQLAMIMGYGPTAAGVEINEVSAMTFSAFWAAVRVLSESLASLPIEVYEGDGDDRKIAVGHPVRNLLRRSPNQDMTPSDFVGTMQAHTVCWGNGYSRIIFNNAGVPVQLLPLLPSHTKVMRRGGNVVYQSTVMDPSGQYNEETFDADEVLHVKGLGFDGLVGYSPVYMARQCLAMGLAAETFGAAFFGNGATPGGLLTTDQVLSDKAVANLRESWNSNHKGSVRSHRTAVVHSGVKFQSMSMPLEDAQFLQTRKFQVVEVSRFMRVPPHMIGDLERATNNNIEQQAIEFLNYSLFPWIKRWEEELTRKLFPANSKYSVEFDLDALLRTDQGTRFKNYDLGLKNGMLSVNEVRRRERLRPIGPEGDIHLAPVNMTTLDKVGQVPQIPATPANKPEPDPERSRRIAATQARNLVAAAERVINRETHQVANFRGKSDKAAFGAWRDKFYAGHQATVSTSLRTPAHALADLMSIDTRGSGPTADEMSRVDAIVDQYTTDHVAESRKQLDAAFADQAIDELVSDWTVQRPAFAANRIADQVINLFLKSPHLEKPS